MPLQHRGEGRGQPLRIAHFHGDHVAGLPAFPNAKILCARAGLELYGAPGDLPPLRPRETAG